MIADRKGIAQPLPRREKADYISVWQPIKQVTFSHNVRDALSMQKLIC